MIETKKGIIFYIKENNVNIKTGFCMNIIKGEKSNID